jgi:hypothetical protein
MPLRRPVAAVAIWLLVVSIAAVVAGCESSPPPTIRVADTAAAESLARAYFATVNGAGNVVAATVRRTTRVTVDGHDAWQVEMSGTVTDPGSGTTHASAVILLVDAVTGDVTLVAQG